MWILFKNHRNFMATGKVMENINNSGSKMSKNKSTIRVLSSHMEIPNNSFVHLIIRLCQEIISKAIKKNIIAATIVIKDTHQFIPNTILCTNLMLMIFIQVTNQCHNKENNIWSNQWHRVLVVIMNTMIAIENHITEETSSIQTSIVNRNISHNQTIHSSNVTNNSEINSKFELDILKL